MRAGSTCPGSTQIACNDDSCGVQSKLGFVALASTTYYILVHGYNSNAGAYTLNVTGTPYVSTNDACPGTTIASLPYTDTGSTRCATNNYTHAVSGQSPEVVYSYTSASCQTVTATLCGSNFDTGLEVKMGGVCPGNTAVASSDDNLCNGVYVSQARCRSSRIPA